MDDYSRSSTRSWVSRIVIVLLLLSFSLIVVYREKVTNLYFEVSTPRYTYSGSQCDTGEVYSDTDMHLSFNYSPEWKVRFVAGSDEDSGRYDISGDRGTVTISFQEVTDSPREFVWNLEGYELDSSSKVDKRWRTTVDEETAWGQELFVWEGMEGSSSDGVYVIECAFEREGYLFMIQYSHMNVETYDEGLCYFEAVMESLMFYD